MEGVADWLEHPDLYVKREDATDTQYGGNKVRNLEFILGDAKKKRSKRVATLAPLGLNFVAALSAQAARLGMENHVYHFIPTQNEQILRHAEFSKRQGAKLHVHQRNYHGGILKSAAALIRQRFAEEGTYVISPGGSNALGSP